MPVLGPLSCRPGSNLHPGLPAASRWLRRGRDKPHRKRLVRVRDRVTGHDRIRRQRASVAARPEAQRVRQGRFAPGRAKSACAFLRPAGHSAPHAARTRARSPSHPAGTCEQFFEPTQSSRWGSTRSARPRHPAQTGSPAAFVDQVFDLEPAQGQLMSFAKSCQSFGGICDRTFSGQLSHALFQ